jgi:hypothetical protein
MAADALAVINEALATIQSAMDYLYNTGREVSRDSAALEDAKMLLHAKCLEVKRDRKRLKAAEVN